MAGTDPDRPVAKPHPVSGPSRYSRKPHLSFKPLLLAPDSCAHDKMPTTMAFDIQSVSFEEFDAKLCMCANNFLPREKAGTEMHVTQHQPHDAPWGRESIFQLPPLLQELQDLLHEHQKGFSDRSYYLHSAGAPMLCAWSSKC